MQQLLLPMLTVYLGLRLVDESRVVECASYREAVRLCWEQRTRRNLTQAQLAAETRLYASHVTDYVSGDHAKRPLPAAAFDAFERACGNRAITQWHLLQVQRTDDEIENVRRAA